MNLCRFVKWTEYISRRFRPIHIDTAVAGKISSKHADWYGKLDSAICGKDTVIRIHSPSHFIRSEADQPSDLQYQALASYLSNETRLRQAVASAIFETYNEIRETNMPGSAHINPFTGENGIENIDEQFPPLEKAADVWKRITDGNIEVMSLPQTGYPGLEISLNWNADWDDEHGLHVLIGDNRVLEARME
ncbi:MAG: hypothetical protein AAF086_09645 [Planctomycetota bacterium]